MKNQYINILVLRNMGIGYDWAYPTLPSWRFRLYMFLIRKIPPMELSSRFGFLIYYRSEVDRGCIDSSSRNRAPTVDMYAFFPWRFDVNNLISQKGNDVLSQCWKLACDVRSKGMNENLRLPLPKDWYAGS